MIEVKDLKAGYNSVEVLHGVSLAVEPGEIVVIMGQSGCGKTTFLRHLMGLQKPSEGTVRIGEMNLADRRLCTLKEGKRVNDGR